MGEETRVLNLESSEENTTRRNHLVHDFMIDLYPLRSYYFGSRDALRVREEIISDRVVRLKSNYASHGLRTCVEAVLLAELFKHPHVLLLQDRNSIFKLPGGRLRPGESGIECLKRKLASKLSINEHASVTGFEIRECIGMWWRPNFETLMYPFLPPNVKHPNVT